MKVLRKIPFLLLLLPLVAAIILYNYFCPRSLPHADISPAIYCLHLLSVPQQREKTVKAEAQIFWRKDSATLKKQDEKAVIYIRKDSLSMTLRQGDILLASASLTHSNRGNPSEFDYDRFLASKGFSGVIFLDGNEWLLVSHEDINTPYAVADRCRQWFVNQLREHGFSEDELGIVAAMAVGERDELRYDTRQRFSAAGAAHVLAVSGLHTGIVYSAILYLLTCFGFYPVLYRQKLRRWLVYILATIFIWLYAFLTGLSPSVMRAALMITIFSLGNALGRDGISFNTLAAAAFINLLIEPQALYSVSFCLSYSAVLGILLFSRKIVRILSFKTKILRYLWNLLAVSVAAQLGTLPATIFYFSQTSNYFALTNFFVIPLAYVIVVLSAMFAIFAVTPLAVWLAYILKGVAYIMNCVVSFIDCLPFSTFNISLTPAMLAVSIVSILLLALCIHREKWQWAAGFAASLLLIAVLHSINLKKIDKTEQTFVYNTYPYSLVLQQQGRACTIYSDSIEAALQVTEPFRKKQMIRVVKEVDLSGIEAAPFAVSLKSVLLLSAQKGHKLVFERQMPADVLLFAGRGNNCAENAISATVPDRIVILSSVPQYREEEIIKLAHSSNIPVLTTKQSAIEILH